VLCPKTLVLFFRKRLFWNQIECVKKINFMHISIDLSIFGWKLPTFEFKHKKTGFCDIVNFDKKLKTSLSERVGSLWTPTYSVLETQNIPQKSSTYSIKEVGKTKSITSIFYFREYVWKQHIHKKQSQRINWVIQKKIDNTQPNHKRKI